MPGLYPPEYEVFADHEQFCEAGLTVQDKSGKLVPMRLGPAQRKLNALVEKQRAKGKPVRIIALKARQVWISMGTAAHFFHDTAFVAGQNALVLAHDAKSAKNLFGYYSRFHTTYKPVGPEGRPPVVLPPADALSEEITYHYGEGNDSRIMVHTAGAKSTGRSFQLRRVHFSEAAYYDDFKSLLASVMSAVPDDADTMAVVESTANGIGDEFHQMWIRANDPQSGSEWEPFFFAWHEHPEYVRAVPGGDRVAFEKSLTEDERAMRKAYGLSLEQLAWRRWTIANTLNFDSELFKQEFPSNPEEAFLSSGRPRFSLAHIRRMPRQSDAIQGGLSIEPVGIERRLVFLPRERGELLVYRKPIPGREYAIGGDCAEGKDANEGKGTSDPDYSCFQVGDCDTGEQVAIVRARLTPAESGRYIAALGRWYNDAFLVPEYNSMGAAFVDAIRGAQYPDGLIYHRPTHLDAHNPSDRSDLIGWKTTQVSRPQLVSLVDECIRSLSILVHDPVTLDELMKFVIYPSGKAEATRGAHDDTVIALGLMIVGIQQRPRRPQTTIGQRLDVERYRRNDSRERRG